MIMRVLRMLSILSIILRYALRMIYEFWWHDYEVMFWDMFLWAFKYVYEIKKWNVFYELYDELKGCGVKMIYMRMIAWSWWVWNVMSMSMKRNHWRWRKTKVERYLGRACVGIRNSMWKTIGYKAQGIKNKYVGIKPHVTPRFLQKSVSENFQFPRDITTSSELNIGSGIYFFFFTMTHQRWLNNLNIK
jgi:hypothetical protein